MKENSVFVNGLRKTQPSPLWKWKEIALRTTKPETRLSPVTEFFQESGRTPKEAVLGPGVGAGIGCGVGLGMGVIGGAGIGGASWNLLTPFFGIGVGCGVGIGLGYGQGFGAGFGFESFISDFLKPKSKSKKRVTVQI